MNSLSFPTSPSINQTYSANGKTWYWDGTTWRYGGISLSTGQTLSGIGTDESVTVTPGNGVYGAYTQVTASLPRSISGFVLYLYPFQNAFERVTLATGASGSEVDFLSDFTVGSVGYAGRVFMGYWPIPLSAGTRIAAKALSLNGVGKFCIVGLIPFTGSFLPNMSRTTSYTSSGTESGSGTSGWTEITPATSRSSNWLGVSMAANSTNYDGTLDIGTGAVGTETVLVADIPIDSRGAGPGPTSSFFGNLPISIAANTRLSFRTKFISNGAGSIWLSTHCSES